MATFALCKAKFFHAIFVIEHFNSPQSPLKFYQALLLIV